MRISVRMKDGAGSIGALSSPHAIELDQLKNIVVFAVLTAIGAKVYIPHEPVPFTLQTLFVVLSGAFLGWRKGTMAMLLYLALGAAGVPVFAGPEVGISVLYGPTAGYLFGFVVSAAAVGVLVGINRSFVWTTFTMVIGFLTIFACGTFYLNEVFVHNWQLSLTQGFLIFSIWDLVKLGAAVAIFRVWQGTHRVMPS